MNVPPDEFAAIGSLDLEPIKVKIMHKESGGGWPLEKANAVEFEYRRYLYLMKKFPNEQAAPSIDVDTFWHYHILDTLKYAEDCQAVFGYFLHHFPYLGLRGEDDLIAHDRVGERMRVLYEDTFSEPYPFSAAADSEDSQPVRASDTAYSLASISAHSRSAGTAYSLNPGSSYSLTPRSAYSLTPSGANTSTADLFSVRPRLPVQAAN